MKRTMRIKGKVGSEGLFKSLLGALAVSKKTGALLVTDGDVERRLFFEEGAIIAATSNNPEESLGHLLVDRAIIQEQDLANAKVHCSKNDVLLGLALVELDLVTEDDVQSAIQLKVSKAISDILSSPEATFEFVNERFREERRVPVLIGIGKILSSDAGVLEKKLARRAVTGKPQIPAQSGVAEVSSEDEGDVSESDIVAFEIIEDALQSDIVVTEPEGGTSQPDVVVASEAEEEAARGDVIAAEAEQDASPPGVDQVRKDVPQTDEVAFEAGEDDSQADVFVYEPKEDASRFSVGQAVQDVSPSDGVTVQAEEDVPHADAIVAEATDNVTPPDEVAVEVEETGEEASEEGLLEVLERFRGAYAPKKADGSKEPKPVPKPMPEAPQPPPPEEPPEIPVRAERIRPPGSSRTPLFVGAGLFAAVVLLSGGYWLFHGTTDRETGSESSRPARPAGDAAAAGPPAENDTREGNETREPRNAPTPQPTSKAGPPSTAESSSPVARASADNRGESRAVSGEPPARTPPPPPQDRPVARRENAQAPAVEARTPTRAVREAPESVAAAIPESEATREAASTPSRPVVAEEPAAKTPEEGLSGRAEPPAEEPSPAGEAAQQTADTSGWQSAVFAQKPAIVKVDPQSEPAVQPGELVEPGPDVIEPVLLEHPDLSYPEEAKRQGIEAVVRVRVLVDENGNVLKAEPEKPVGYGLDTAAVSVAVRAKFIPATKGSVLVKMWTVLSLEYRLKDN